MKYPTPPTGTGFVIVAIGAVVAALGVIQVEVQGLTEHTRQMTGIRTSVRPTTTTSADRKDNTAAMNTLQQRAPGLMPVVNEAAGK